MKPLKLIGLATLGSIALLGGAYAFQHIGGLAPCKMCLWQRWPHAAAIGIGIVALALRETGLALLGAIAALATAAVGLYHAGVEQKWWQGPNTCTSSSNDGLTTSELFDKIMAAPITRCDEIAWDFLGLSMAGWNGVLSAALAGIWLLAFLKRPT
ncbi:dihydroneopterin aldolase [Amylibacter marinus]|uniref:Dihydroneopterin aldolase n=1 Tax=Amylibacter marinus TaxID=1475483 RepID=A0ABQ5VRJ7_9RHOB|nr:disulfide bond formation protein B [Amylibacter marinus]GLQ34028.1 dihydroneopterin aldolase [Amylibacter marinus]